VQLRSYRVYLGPEISGPFSTLPKSQIAREKMSHFSENSVVLEIQRDLASHDISISKILSKAYLLARKLQIEPFANWLSSEISGYQDSPNESIPKYRLISVRPRYKNPYNGWQKVVFEDPDEKKYYEVGILNQPISELELAIGGSGEKLYYYPEPLSTCLSRKLSRDLGVNALFEVAGIFSSSNLQVPITAVRKMLMDWTLNLEKNGILGEGMTFSRAEVEKAMPITQNIYAENIGVIGEVSNNRSVRISSGNTPDRKIISDATDKIEKSLIALPTEIQADVISALTEIRKRDFDPQISREKFSFIKRLMEGASGNLTAEAIIAMIAKIVG
jgi:hypothetical protein